jgi:ribosomal protein L11 methyltransferase
MSDKPLPAGATLWRAAFVVPGAAPPDDLGTLEDLALSVSLFAVEDPATAEPVAWRVGLFFQNEPAVDALRRELARAFGGWVPEEIEVTEVPERDWIAASAMHHEPVRVGRFFVHAAKDRGRVPAGAVAIEVEAGMAFGSGEHATTQACLEAVDALARSRRFRGVLDLGCGSGVLAIAAARCWPAARVVAADSDPVAVRVAKENLDLNGVAGRVEAVVSEGFAASAVRRGGPYDLILANILADPLVELAPAVARHLAPGGAVVLSGLLDRQAAGVTRAYVAQGLRPLRQIDRSPWAGLVLAAPRLARLHIRRGAAISAGLSSPARGARDG